MEFEKWEQLLHETFVACSNGIDEFVEKIPKPHWMDKEDEQKMQAAIQVLKENLIALRTIAMIPYKKDNQEVEKGIVIGSFSNHKEVLKRVSETY